MTETDQMNADELVYLSRDPLNAETRLERQLGLITPAARHYVRDHFAIPEPPQRLAIDGAVRTPLQLDPGDLRSLPRRSLVVTLECAGNGRAFLDPPAAGEQWRTGAVSTTADAGRIAYERSLPIADAMREEVLLAYAMNGEDLTREHGAPLRLVMP